MEVLRHMRFCYLKNNVFTWYAKHDDLEPAGKINVSQTTELEIEDDYIIIRDVKGRGVAIKYAQF